MPMANIERINWIGKNKPSILTFTNRHGEEIGDTTQDFDPGLENESYIDPLTDEFTGACDTNDRPTGTDFDGKPTGVDVDTESTGVEVEADNGEIHEPVPQEQGDNGLGQQVPTTPEATAEPSSLRW